MVASGEGWYFKKKDADESENERDDDRIFSESPDAESLVNEAGQNINDEKISEDSTEPLRFVITEGVVGPEYKSFVKNLFAPQFKDHLKASGYSSEDADLLDCDGDITFLTLEDFGTKGLVGDINQSRADKAGTPKDKRNNFYDFNRRMGKSGKTAGEHGSKGVGKHVFQTASRVAVMFSFTRRATDGEEYFFGRSNLRYHPFHGNYYGPFGQFSANHTETGHLQMPIDDPVFINKVRNAFKLQRKEGESGLSIIIPFPTESIKKKNLVNAVVERLFLPIVTNDMKVVVKSEGQRDAVFDFDHLTEKLPGLIRDHGNQGEYNELQLLHKKRMYELIADMETHPSPIESKLLSADSAPIWPSDLETIFSDTDIVKMREQYLDGKIVQIKMNLHVSEKRGPAKRTFFTVAIQKDDSITNGRDIVLARNKLLIPWALSRQNHRVTQRGFRAFLRAEDGPLVELLRVSEGGAHDRWAPSEPELAKQYKRGPSTVTFVNQAIGKLIQAVLPPAEGVSEDEFSDYFFVESPIPDQDATGVDVRTKKNKVRNPDDDGVVIVEPPYPPDIRRAPVQWVVTDHTEPHRITATPSGETVGNIINGDRFRIRCGYTRSDSTAIVDINKHKKYDFDFKDSEQISVSASGLKTEVKSKNEIVFEALLGAASGDEVPEITITGFDGRDVSTKIDRVSVNQDD